MTGSVAQYRGVWDPYKVKKNSVAIFYKLLEKIYAYAKNITNVTGAKIKEIKIRQITMIYFKP